MVRDMRKNVSIIFALIMLTACRGRQTQAESAGADGRRRRAADAVEVQGEESGVRRGFPRITRICADLQRMAYALVIYLAFIASHKRTLRPAKL